MREQAVTKVPFQQRGRIITLLAGLVVPYAAQDDLKGAETAVAEIERLHSESKNWKNPRPEDIAGYNSALALAKADLNQSTGKYADAERYRRQAAAALAADPSGPSAPGSTNTTHASQTSWCSRGGCSRPRTRRAGRRSAPEVATVEGNGLLTMEEILAIRLNAD